MAQIFVRGIQDKILDHIFEAEREIIIMVAWFTNPMVIKALLNTKYNNPRISIRIMVTNDEINRKYFSPYEEELTQAGIKIDKYIKKNLLHNKVMLCDKKIALTGSYNYSKKANWNEENIVILKGRAYYNYYYRIYRSLNEVNYVDKNIELLFKYPDFARQLLSTYYPFTKTEIKKFKSKFEPGYCYVAAPYGRDQLFFGAGLVFNESAKYLDPNTENYFDLVDFRLPIHRSLVLDIMINLEEIHIIDSYSAEPEYYNEISPALKWSRVLIKKDFEQNIKNYYPKNKLEEKIAKGVDLIKENDLWEIQFAPFISKGVMTEIFEKLPDFHQNDILF